ncbi:vacuolar protein sorting-associated protein 16 homolog [Exaiptasia diaphana]|uniref:Vacuolar protein sorting-associated protein 16 homolog n=1 Tax=Exaiptasia diaphana TaxID=2652724 RepID=A0A913Y9T1_EXADI|nr:vacuolar protein sorting-associated protein 16 homolog [Exaiptasia diaphana]KXJ28267.1 Vacuolar protein sorting-associated protein 16-like [Exaiptasia diaphana]
MAHFTGDWTPLGEVFFRKLELYSMGWSVDLKYFTVAAASYGGPIALMPNNTSSVMTKPIINLYSSSGKELATFRWDGGPIVQLDWSAKEELLCISMDGSVSVYDIHGVYQRTFSMGQDAKESKVIDSKTFRSSGGTGIAILTGNYHFFAINNVDDVRSRKFVDPPNLSAPPTSWIIIPEDRGSQALVAIDSQLYLIDTGQCVQLYPSFKEVVTSIVEMALSSSGTLLTMFTDTGLVWIGTRDVQKVYCEVNTQCLSRPKQLAWCSNAAVVCYWDDYLDVIGPTTDVTKYVMDSDVCLVQEIDGVRVIGNETHELLQKVPPSVENVFKIGSVNPGAMLYDAAKEFEKKSARADEYVRLIKDELTKAVEQCIQAAGAEFEPSVQRGLLRAASLGKSFLTDFSPKPFVTMCQSLRVLNAVREYTIGIPLTFAQLQQMSIPVLIDRLVLRRHYCLAIRICDYLKIPKAEGASRILGHWACYKVQQTNVDDEEIACAINAKLGESTGISYTEIASKALECGRTFLAIRLLDYEPKAADQVPLLMRMKKDDLALEKAILSGDTDLIYTVVMHLKDTLPLGEFLRAIRHLPDAQSLFTKYCKEHDRRSLVDLYYQEDNFLNSGNVYLRDSFNETTLESRKKTLETAQLSYTQGNCTFYSKCTDEFIKLLDYQNRLENEQRKPFVDLSLSDTISQCIRLRNFKAADQLKKEFKVPDKRFHWLKVRALAESMDWIELDKFAKSKRSPIGYEPFVDACLEANNRLEAEKYLPRVQPENKVLYHVKLGKLEEAAGIAANQNNEELLEFVLKKCENNPPLYNKVQNMILQKS